MENSFSVSSICGPIQFRDRLTSFQVGQIKNIEIMLKRNISQLDKLKDPIVHNNNNMDEWDKKHDLI